MGIIIDRTSSKSKRQPTGRRLFLRLRCAERAVLSRIDLLRSWWRRLIHGRRSHHDFLYGSQDRCAPNARDGHSRRCRSQRPFAEGWDAWSMTTISFKSSNQRRAGGPMTYTICVRQSRQTRRSNPFQRARALCSNAKRSSRSIWMGGRSEDLTEISELDNLIRNFESTCARCRNFFS
jgi:hypothetical protein